MQPARAAGHEHIPQKSERSFGPVHGRPGLHRRFSEDMFTVNQVGPTCTAGLPHTAGVCPPPPPRLALVATGHNIRQLT